MKKNNLISTIILAVLILLVYLPLLKAELMTISDHQHKDRLLQISVDEKIIYIVPDDYQDYDSLKMLNDTIKKAYPKIKEKNYAVYKSSEVACNDWNRLEENTLILIGDRSNNNAIKCTVWFDVGKKPSDTFTASVTLERNVWGGNNYAIVLSGNTTQAIYYLKDLIENPERHELAENTQTIYLNEFSMPPEYTTGKDYINGYALGQCENINEGDGQLGCHILSFGTYFVPYVGWAAVGRDVGNYCLVAEHDGTDWFGCAASASAIGVKLGLVGKTFNWLKPTTELKAYTKLQTIIRSHTPQHADNILNTLNINNKQKIKNFFQTNKQGTALENELANKLDELERTLRQNKKGIRTIAKLHAESTENTLSSIKYAEDLQNAAKGAEKALKTTSDINKIAPEATNTQKIGFFKNVGKMNDELADDVSYISDIKGVQKLADNIVRQGGGYELEAKTARKLREKGAKISELGKPLKKSDGEIDIILEDETIYEVKGWSPNDISDLKRELDRQITKYKSYYPDSEIIIVRPNGDKYYQQLLEWISQYNKVKIKLLEEI